MTTNWINPAFHEVDPYGIAYRRFETSEESRYPAWLKPVRQDGISHFAQLGLPNVTNEEWRFTNVSHLQKRPFTPILAHTHPHIQIGDIERFFIPEGEHHRLVFIDGHYSARLSSGIPKTEGVKAGSIASAFASDSNLIERYLGRCARVREDAFVALNAAFFQDGAFILVPQNCQLKKTIHLLYVNTTPEAGAAVQPRNIIVVQKGSELHLVESYVGLKNSDNFTNAVTEVVLGENAVMEHTRIQEESLSSTHIGAVRVRQEANSTYTSHSIALGAKISRCHIHAELEAEGCQSNFNGLFIGSGEQLIDHHTVMDHAKSLCESHEYYNGILDGHAHGVFNGIIKVFPGAQKTDASQTNRNLLLSNDATIDTKPQLEIFADDVKCTHGATVGQLDDEALFYLRSRGIGADLAKQILIHAFAGQIIQKCDEEAIRNYIDMRVMEKLGKILSSIG